MAETKNLAAWIPAPKADLEVKAAPMYEVAGDEILIKNQAISIQPFDARIRHEAYVKVPYPFILGNTVAGTIVAVGENAAPFKVGDRVVSDTSAYKKHFTKNGAWQQYVVGNAGWTSNIGDASFEEAIALPFPLQTAVGALNVYLGMGRPGESTAGLSEKKVLIWGAGGAVGGYAVQYAKSVGYTVIATASPRGFEHLQKLGASVVLDYKSPTVTDDLRKLGPYAFLYTTSGDAASQTALSLLLQPHGGSFASVLGGDVDLPSNVTRIYEFFGNVTQKEGPQFAEFAKWWYGEYLGEAIREHKVEATPFEKRPGGLKKVQKAADDVFNGKTRSKLVLDPQEE